MEASVVTPIAEHRGNCRPVEPKFDRTFHVCMLLLAVGILLASIAAHIDAGGHVTLSAHDGGISLPTTCVTKLVTNMDCPGCGLTRGFVAIVHGRIAQAWRFNRVSLYMFVLIAVQIPFRLYALLVRRREFAGKAAANLRLPCKIAVVLLLANWLFNLLS